MNILSAMYLNMSFISLLSFIFQLYVTSKYLSEYRFIGYLSTQICISSFSCYLIMYTNEFSYVNQFLRYLNWIISTPCTITIMGIIASIGIYNIYFLCVMDVFMILFGILGKLTNIEYLKYIYFSFGLTCFIPITIFLFSDFDFDVMNNFFGYYIAKKYYWISQYITSLWSVYPIIWILHEQNLITYEHTEISYCVIDFFSKFIFIHYIYFCLSKSHHLNSHRKQSQSIQYDDNEQV